MLPNHVLADVGGGTVWGPVQKLPSWAPAPHLFTCGCSRSGPSLWNAGPTRSPEPGLVLCAQCLWRPAIWAGGRCGLFRDTARDTRDGPWPLSLPQEGVSEAGA